jgi:hypothetical protein
MILSVSEVPWLVSAQWYYVVPNAGDGEMRPPPSREDIRTRETVRLPHRSIGPYGENPQRRGGGEIYAAWPSETANHCRNRGIWRGTGLSADIGISRTFCRVAV